jgi:hypothetical protein
MTRVLIVANQTACGQHLHDEVKRRSSDEECSFTLLVPSSRPHGTFTWTDGQARALARRRMEAAIEQLKDIGVPIQGVVGVAPTAYDTVMDAVRIGDFDEIIISTLPHHLSHWLKLDLPSRVERHTGKPVTHIIGEPAAEQALAV